MENYQNALVTAVIITYKRPLEILERAIRSAIGQTHANMEVIVVNDYPADQEMVEAIRSMIASLHDSRIRYIVHERNSGACKARNTGIMAAKGEFIALLDDDDEWLPDKTEQQLRGFTSDKVGMVYSPFYNITKDLPGTIAVRGTKSGNLLEDMLWTNRLGGSSMSTIRRGVFDVCGLFDETLLSSQDYDMWVRIAQQYEINFVEKPLTRRYLLAESITNNYEKQFQGSMAFLEKHKDLLMQYPAAYNFRLNHRANKCFEQGYHKEARRLCRMAVKVKPFSRYNVTEPVRGMVKYLFRIKRS